MNPQYQSPNSYFPPFIPMNPNPNSNLSFPQFPPKFNQFSTPQQNPLPDLSNSLSSIQSLLQISQSTLNCLSSLTPSLSLSSGTTSLVQCPTNPHHRVPSSSLFRHSLQCPTPLDVELGAVIDTLQYPNTLKTEKQLIEQNKFVQPLQDPTAELCFSLDDYVDFESNFFYQDCPGVVNLSEDDASQRRVFTLPGVLSVECANFISHGNEGNDGFWKNGVKVLPSEIWSVGCDVDRWIDYPSEYLYSVLRTLLCLEFVRESDMSEWVIVNSPRFGVVVDVPMRNHMVVLIRLCLKAIVREAAHTFGTLFDRNLDNDGGQLDLKSLSFKCPILVEALRWLSLQLSVLYGETNAHFFTIAMLKHLLHKSASYASLFPLVMDMDRISRHGQETCMLREQPSGKLNDNEVNRSETLFSKAVFVYQIAAAIAALHERSLFEARIKAFRMPLSLSSYQRANEHAYLTKKADEERQKRPDYRPLIEHDSLPTQRQHDQETNMTKTREELLAEERDYKRRRMSYRGKKLKRNTREVMRDIIEEYMEAIKQTGGIGCLVKGEEGGATSALKSPTHGLTDFMPNRSASRDERDGYRAPSQDYHTSRDRKAIGASQSRYDRQKDSFFHGNFEGRGSTSRDRYDRRDRDLHSRSPSRDRRHGQSRDHRSHGRNHDA